MSLRHRVYLEANFSGLDCGGILPEFCQNSHAIPQTVSHWADRAPKSLLHSQFGLEAEVGIELGNLVVPILTNSKQFNRLRSFPSEISLSEAVEKIKNYPVSSCSKFSHHSASIILLELLLEVAPGFRRSFSGSETLSPPSRMMQSQTTA
jgi:hypothetical protein